MLDFFFFIAAICLLMVTVHWLVFKDWGSEQAENVPLSDEQRELIKPLIEFFDCFDTSQELKEDG